MPKRNENSIDLKEIEKSLNERINELQPAALRRAGALLGRDVTVQSLHGIIGSKNIQYADTDKRKFENFDIFIQIWRDGLIREKQPKWGMDKAANRLALLYNDPILKEYIDLFLERNFYRMYIHRKA